MYPLTCQALFDAIALVLMYPLGSETSVSRYHGYIPVILENGGALAARPPPSHIVSLCSWGFGRLPRTTISNDFGYIPMIPGNSGFSMTRSVSIQGVNVERIVVLLWDFTTKERCASRLALRELIWPSNTALQLLERTGHSLRVASCLGRPDELWNPLFLGIMGIVILAV